MAPNQTSYAPALRLERTLAAPPEKVFDAWTQPEALSRWFGPNEDCVSEVPLLELKVGGRYRIVMNHPGGRKSTVGGIYRQIDRPNRLAFTWQWEDDTAPGEMLVTVEFAPDGAGTRLVLTHERCVTAESRTAHEQGWNGALARLTTRMATH